MYGENGKEYIDMGSGIAVNTFGVADEEWIGAVTNQLSALQHCSNLYYSEPCVRLAQLLCERTGMSKVFFCNSGAEANECAIKAARKYGQTVKGEDYYTVITLKNSFHGRTITTLSATGQDVFHKDFTPMTEGFIHVTPNDINELEAAVKNNKVAAIMIECIQGEGGVLALDDEYVKACRRIADENDLLLVVDEVQAGNGRSGKLYSYMNYGIEPDVFTTAKGLGGGLPIGAAIMNEKAAKLFTAGSNGSTFGGNPAVCAGAYSILSRISNNHSLASAIDCKTATFKEVCHYHFCFLLNSIAVLFIVLE
jgi:acetylornithine/N-succinyldiaminopimelate aminotransferase